MTDAETGDVENSLELRSLAPRYDEKQHGVYLDALTRALNTQGDVRNIALTGAYGTGKSSVLQHLTEMDEYRDRVLELSLSTVGVVEKRADAESDTNPTSSTKANLIQKEIVKQILYRDPPQKTRGSRFRRLARFRWGAEIGFAFAVGALALALLWIVGLAAPLMRPLGADPAFGWFVLANIALLLALSGIVCLIRWGTHNRIFLEKLSAGPATVSLAATSSSYFDQYLDEIVYYFEQSGRDIAIFEDIDRFEDVHIFEALRALNTLLNGAEQVRRRRRSRRGSQTPDVKFIYALRDSVFEKLGEGLSAETTVDGEEDQPQAPSDAETADHAADEVRRANRTKFFDIVIPIVPFITHRNARDLMLEQMKGTNVSRDLINIAARFVADMRLITDMRNEYDIYANRLLDVPNQMPGLDADRLFALILYKCVHMADFEAIRFGSSDLDLLHDAWRNIVASSLKKAQAQERVTTAQLGLEGILASRAKALGDRLEAVMKAMPINRNHSDHAQFAVDNTEYSGDALRTRELWHKIAIDHQPIAFTNRYNGSSTPLSLEHLQALMGIPFDHREWLTVDQSAEAEKQRKAREHISFLRHHTWSEIYARRQYTSSLDDGGVIETFEQATDRLLKSKLAKALVAADYLNEYFALYVSIYYGEHLRPRALNYIIHTLDRGIPDFHYELDGDDVEAIIVDKGTDIFRDKAAFNVHVLDHLLRNRPDAAELIVSQLIGSAAADDKFGDIYLQSGTERVAFIRMLAPLLPETILWFVSDAPHDVRDELIDAALDYTGAQIGGTVDHWMIIDRYTDFPSITTTPEPQPGKPPRAHGTIDAIAKLGVRLPDTRPLNDAARSRVRELGAYELNALNIEDLTGHSSIALDAIRSRNIPVYHAALGRLDDYVQTLARDERARSIEDPDHLLPVLHDLDEAGASPEHLDQLIRKASPGPQITDITTTPKTAWAALAASRRLVPSASNVMNYLDSVGAVDDNLAAVLSDTWTIEDPAAVAVADREKIAVAVLEARDTIVLPDGRTALANSLRLTEPLNITLLSPESGSRTGLLIMAGIIPDDATTFASNLIPDWATREFALAESHNAANFIGPATLPPAELAPFFRSRSITRTLKSTVLAGIAAFLPEMDREASRAAARYAIETSADLTFPVIDQLRVRGVSESDTVALLTRSSTVTLDELRVQLRTLPTPYPTIADRGTLRPAFPDDDAHRRLLDRLKAAGIVSDHKSERGLRRVSLRRPS